MYRRNLRLADNRGLAAGADGDAGDAVSVFVFDDDVLSHVSDAHVRFILDSLAELRATYRDRGRAELAPDYPDPIVDHGERREQALAMFERVRGDEPE